MTDALREMVLSFLPRVEVRHLRYPVRWRVTAPGVEPVVLTLIAGVNDRDHGQIADTLRHLVVRPDITPTGLARLMLDQLQDFMAHEAAEAFHVDGVRVFDPHAPPVDVGAPRGYVGGMKLTTTYPLGITPTPTVPGQTTLLAIGDDAAMFTEVVIQIWPYSTRVEVIFGGTKAYVRDESGWLWLGRGRKVQIPLCILEEAARLGREAAARP